MKTITDLEVTHFTYNNVDYDFATWFTKAGTAVAVIIAPNGKKYQGKAHGGGYNKKYGAAENAFDELFEDIRGNGVECYMHINKFLDTLQTVFC
ncbi:MAG: hypothetical protein [Caudoviricetes sp.]|nr:MAG: hypothetical protein [Caudoviricetes sp.]